MPWLLHTHTHKRARTHRECSVALVSATHIYGHTHTHARARARPCTATSTRTRVKILYIHRTFDFFMSSNTDLTGNIARNFIVCIQGLRVICGVVPPQEQWVCRQPSSGREEKSVFLAAAEALRLNAVMGALQHIRTHHFCKFNKRGAPTDKLNIFGRNPALQ